MNIVYIKKPLYGNMVYIRDKYIDQAIQRHEKLCVMIPQGQGIIDPGVWKLDAIRKNRVMKKVFKFADDPMKLYGGFVPLPEKVGKVEKQVNYSQMSII
jgi:hypothetical protein